MSGRKALADWEAEELRLLRSRGASLRELAERFCVSERTVERYVKDYVKGPEACEATPGDGGGIMTGIERLRELARIWTCDCRVLVEQKKLADIADQIEREQEALVREAEDVSGRDGDALAWVEEHGGLEALKAHWSGRVALSHVHNMAERHKAKVARMQRHIEHVQGVCKTRAHRIVELNRTIAEMRPRLMPEGMEWLVEAWPRFEDSEPVRFLDDFERYGDENGVSAVTMYSDGSFALNFRAYSKGERVKRPAPEALDADGVPFRDGDTVWLTDGRGPWSVSRIVYADRLRVICDDEENGHLNVYPQNLTHRAPVLAADGKPLREGETVYGIGRTQHRFVVRAASDYEEDEPDGRFCVPCIDKDDGDEECWCDPSQLTHERPDSWERLEEDANVLIYDIGFNLGDYSPSCFKEEGDSVQDRVRDLVRRARALAERGR